jgi:hypothetical protein
MAKRSYEKAVNRQQEQNKVPIAVYETSIIVDMQLYAYRME